MRFTLKAGRSSFRLLNGSHAGAVFEHGKSYDSVPKEQEYMFDKIADPTPDTSFGASAEPANGVRRRRAAVAGGNDAP